MKRRTIAVGFGKVTAVMLLICMLFGVLYYDATVKVEAAERTTCYATLQVVKRLNMLEEVMNNKYFGAALRKMAKSDEELRQAIDEGKYDTDYYSIDEIRAALGITDNGKYTNSFNKNAGGCHAFALCIEYILFGKLALKGNTGYFVKYSGKDLDNLILQPGDFLRESPWYTSSGKKKEHSAVVWKTAGPYRDAKVSVIESNISSGTYGANYIMFGSKGFRNSPDYDTNREITDYLKAHDGFVLRYKYIENNGYNDDDRPSISVDVVDCPSWIRFKRYFNVTGSITCDCPGDILTEVRSYIRSERGFVTYDETVEYPMESSLNLRYAAVNLYSDFNKLPRGNYRFEIEASSKYGGSITWGCSFTIY